MGKVWEMTLGWNQALGPRVYDMDPLANCTTAFIFSRYLIDSTNTTPLHEGEQIP